MSMVMVMSAMFLSASFDTVQAWNFQEEASCQVWHANAFFEGVHCSDGLLHARAVDWDPFFVCSGIEIPARPGQFVRIKINATAPGRGQLFWTGALEGKHGGFEEGKVTDFSVRASGDLEEIYLFPYWHGEGVIRQLRLDLYDDAEFSIAEIAILSRPAMSAAPNPPAWNFDGGVEASDWMSVENGSLVVSPPMEIPVEQAGWLSVKASAPGDSACDLFWTTTAQSGAQKETIYLRGGEEARTYHVELQGSPRLKGALAGMHLVLPRDGGITVHRVSLAPEPDGPPEIDVVYFGFENGVSRAGRPESVLAQFTNRGGGRPVIDNLRLDASPGIRVRGTPKTNGPGDLLHGERLEVRGTVIADHPGAATLTLSWNDGATPLAAELVFEEPLSHTADYVPPPVPIQTTREILAYYFPGWNAAAKWDCIKETAPLRKPLLGYYDESLVECVDWQIKWAAENGISCFLVDWYWCQGGQHLLHWFEAYRAARYREHLQVALMWANHNPPGTHNREDWRAVTREWIDKYFTLDTYYRINGKPAIFIWDARGIRNDLGGSDQAAAAFAESQEMARAAGYEGIEFVVLQHTATEQDTALFIQEGYGGHTSYHEWGNALEMAPSPAQARFVDMAATAPQSWEKRRALSNRIDYYPLVETGWDSRPWHGASATAFHGRTVDLFRQLLESARDYCDKHGQETIILGPVNEWGEGSYIEPNLEFGFRMYEAIRDVFGKGDPGQWPRNTGPRDVGLGPYDFPPAPEKGVWTFDTGEEGWSVLMGVSNFGAADGQLCLDTTSGDPALVVSTGGIAALRYPKVALRMSLTGVTGGAAGAQLFWTLGSSGTSESASLPFEVVADGVFHEYILDLNAHPRWRGQVATLRLDPCDVSGVHVCLEDFTLVRE